MPNHLRVAIVVSFDLHGPTRKGSETYTRIKKDLAKKLKIKKIAPAKSGRVVKLPFNTFFGYFPARLADRSTSYLRDLARRKVVEVIGCHHKAATIFVFVGRDLRWGKKKIAA